MDLDLIEEIWERAHIKMVAYQYKVTYYFNAKVLDKVFKVGNLVL